MMHPQGLHRNGKWTWTEAKIHLAIHDEVSAKRYAPHSHRNHHFVRSQWRAWPTGVRAAYTWTIVWSGCHASVDFHREIAFIVGDERFEIWLHAMRQLLAAGTETETETERVTSAMNKRTNERDWNGMECNCYGAYMCDDAWEKESIASFSIQLHLFKAFDITSPKILLQPIYSILFQTIRNTRNNNNN